MQKLLGIPQERFPLDGLNKVSNLMEYDGPILSHYVDVKGNNFLFYWVDYDEQFNRWLVWQVLPNNLYEYIRGHSSLLDIMQDASMFFSIDVDGETQYKNVYLLKFDSLPSEYIPDNNSYYEFDIKPFYLDEIKRLDKDSYENPTMYLANLREYGYYFTLKSNLPRYGRAVKTKDAAEFLLDIRKSSSEYFVNDFYNTYKNKYTNIDSFNFALGQIKKASETYVVDTKFSSFEVMLSVDSIMGFENETAELRSWRRNIFNKYNEDVINVDYESTSAMEEIMRKFPDKVSRDKIIKPILDILSKKEYVFQSRDARSLKVINHKNIDRDIYKKYIGRSPFQDSEKKRKIVTFTVEVSEENGAYDLSRRSIESGLLFQRELSQVELNVSFINVDNVEILFRQPLIYKYYIDENNMNNIVCETFDVHVQATSKYLVQKMFQKELSQKVMLYQNNENTASVFERYVEEVRIVKNS